MKLKKQFKKINEQRNLVFVSLLIIMGIVFEFYNKPSLVDLILSLGSLYFAGFIAFRIYHSLRIGRYGVDILAFVAVVSAILLKEHWAAIVIVFMYITGDGLEKFAEKKAKKELTALMSRAPKKAHVRRKNQEIEINVSEVLVGDILIIKPGEIVPVDCQITQGNSSFDESSITGESMPIDKSDGDQVLSGSVNLDGLVVAKALLVASDSQYEQIVKLVQSAASSQSPFVRMADRYSIPFTVLSFAIAGGAWWISGESIRFLEVLVVATPCPLILGAPIALISGMTRGAKDGIIAKTGSTFEKLSNVKTFAFDKTGTLTKGEPVIKKIDSFNNHSSKDVLTYAASISQNSNHVLSKAIVDYAKKKDFKLFKTKNVDELAGNGIEGYVNGKLIMLGRPSFITNKNIELPNHKIKNYKNTITCLAVDNKVVGIISFEDQIRDDTIKTIGLLQKLGIHNFLMVTGDNSQTANMIAEKIGITKIKSNCLPADKLIAVESVKKRPVAYVGDGINDAPVLISSDVGIALGAKGSSIATESADIVIMLNDLTKVAKATLIAKRTFYIAKQSVLMGIFISIGLMMIFATGLFKPIYGALIQEVVDVIVIINALRARTD